MIDANALEQIVEVLAPQLDDLSSRVSVLLIAAGLAILTMLANIVVQFVLKRRDRKNSALLTRDQKSMAVVEALYERLDDLSRSSLVGPTDGTPSTGLLREIAEVRKFHSVNHIHLTDKVHEIVKEALDYYSSIASDMRMKDAAKERHYRERLRRQFRRI